MASSLVSVVIPVRNRAALVGRAIASVTAQTHPVHEIIVVDDASTDDTVAALAAIAAREPRLRIVPLPERVGAPRARNRGAAEANGELIAFLDSDDRWRPTKTAAQVALLAAHPDSPAAFTGITYLYPDRKPYDRMPPARVELDDLLACNELGTCSVALVRRQAFEKVGGFAPDLPSCQDWELWLRLAELGPMVSVTEPLLEYFFDDSARISRNADAVIAGHAIVHAGILARVSDPARRRALRIAHHRGLAALLSRRTFAPGPAMSHALAALMAEPGTANLRLLVETALRIVTHPIRRPLRDAPVAAPASDSAPSPAAIAAQHPRAGHG